MNLWSRKKATIQFMASSLHIISPKSSHFLFGNKQTFSYSSFFHHCSLCSRNSGLLLSLNKSKPSSWGPLHWLFLLCIILITLITWSVFLRSLSPYHSNNYLLVYNYQYPILPNRHSLFCLSYFFFFKCLSSYAIHLNLFTVVYRN